MRPEEEIDSLAVLEERIRHTIELVSRWRQEKEAALREAAEAREQITRLSQEVEALRTERQQVRTRIEKLLQQIDALSSG